MGGEGGGWSEVEREVGGEGGGWSEVGGERGGGRHAVPFYPNHFHIHVSLRICILATTQVCFGRLSPNL